ncbi:MAG: WD40 repeat domain-containing protein [Pseudomonadales bacterium]|nr:WD40 repeat domain-containing protein [Pseudomonadales bacterium]
MNDTKKIPSFYETDLGEAPVALDWSATGRWVAAINVNSSVMVVDTKTGTGLKRWIAHEDGALALVWHPRLPVFVTSSLKGEIKTWQVEDDQIVSKLSEIALNPDSGSSWIETLSWRPDGKQLAIATGSSVILCSVKGDIEAEFSFPGGTVAAIAWHPRGSLLGIAGYGGVYIYNALDPGDEPIVLKWKGSILSLSWSPDGAFIVAGCQDNTVHLWRFRSRQDAQMSGFAYKPLQLTWVDRGKRLLTGGTSELVIWPFDKKGPEGRAPETRAFHEHAICAIAVTSNGKSIASGCRNGRIAIWKSSRDTEPKTWTTLDSRVEQLHWSPAKQSKLFAATSRQGLLQLFDASGIV